MTIDTNGKSGASGGGSHRPTQHASVNGSDGTGARGQDPVTVLLILEDAQSRNATRAAVQSLPGIEIVAERSELRNGLLLARQRRPRIVLIDLPSSYEEALNAAGHFKMDAPDVALFFLCGALDPQFLLKAIRAGAQEVLKKPLERALLQEAVERVSRSGAARSAPGTRARSIITLFSTKGGVGTTTVATNLAVCLKAQLHVEHVALADFHAQEGGAAHMLGLRAERSIADLLRSPRLDSTTLHMNLLKHGTGVHVLAQPEDLAQIEPITPSQAAEVLDALAGSHEAVVVDAPHSFDEVSLEILDRSSTILLLTELSIPAIRAARRALEVLERLHFMDVPDRVRLIVNRYTGNRGFISLDQLSEAVAIQPYHTIHNDYRRVFTSVNAGRALCMDDPDSPAARDITSLAAKLLGREMPTAPAEESIRRGLFGRKVLR